MKKHIRLDTKQRNLLLILGFLLISIPIGVFLYYANKPIFSYNYIEDNFEDQIPGCFPMGWVSAVNPLNVKVVLDSGNKVMQVKDTGSTQVTEIVRKFKKCSEGIIECDIKALDQESGFVLQVPQLDREYNPYDDIIVIFLKGNIYVVGEENILYLPDVDPSILEQIVLVNNNVYLIDEWHLENSTPVGSYKINEWFSVRIEFSREQFSLTINELFLGFFNYPKYNPPYFASLYFWSLITPSNFSFYADNVKITLSQPVDYIHPANLILILIIPTSAIIFYYLYKRKKRG